MKRIDLNGAWGLGWHDGARMVAGRPTLIPQEPLFATANVPGEIHLDLMREGLIGDPDIGLNSVTSRWVDDATWWYHRDVEVPAESIGDRAWLCFEQLDLIAQVYLNGEPVGRHENSFRPFRVEVTGRLLSGVNHVAVEIKAWRGGVGTHPLAPGEMDGSVDWNRHSRRWSRKATYQWSWDWASRYLNVGIGGDAYLQFTDRDLLVHETAPVVTVSPDLSTGTVRARVVLENVGDAPVQARLRVDVAGSGADADIEVAPGEAVHEVVVTVDDPELWWPNGHGAQALHALTLRVESEGVDEVRTATVGFRRIEVDQSPHPDAGTFFIVRVNNRPIFCKGGNTAPLDTIPLRVDRARYEKLIELALESHFNFLRVNGVGIYESDLFYELCDRAGILVWQDFNFSVARYPADDREFLEEVAAEVTWQTRRLVSHPSLAIWCGQNETEWHLRTPGTAVDVLPDYHVFHLLIPSILEREDPDRYYAPCSPHSPGTTEYPNAEHLGDQHSWFVGMGTSWDIRDYRASAARFSTEAGIIGPGSLPTLRGIAGGDGRPRGSLGWHLHDNPTGQWGSTGVPISQALPYGLFGVDIEDLHLEGYVYWGGLAQGEGLREYVDNLRRRWPDSAAAVFWSFNDSWPVSRSWTTIDFYQRRNPSFWAVRRAMAPVVPVVVGDAESVRVYGVNDTADDVTAELESGFFRMDALGNSAVRTVTIPAGTSIVLEELDPWPGDPTSTVPYAVLRRAGEVDARSRLILPLHRELAWVPATPTVTLADGVATFRSDAFVLGVCLDLDGETALPDNMFDLYPGQPYSIPWRFDAAPRILHHARFPGGAT
jgi:beta-mannosidase